MDIESMLRLHGGVARARDLVRTREERRKLAEAVRIGYVHDAGRGWYALWDADPARILALRLNAVVTCVTAARMHELPLVTRDPRVHLGITAGRGVPPAAADDARVVVHRTRSATAGRVAPVADALAVALRCADELTAVALVDAARKRGLVTLDDLATRLRGPGTAAVRARLALTSDRSRSVTETIARLVLREAGFEVQEGVVIPGVGEVDLVVNGRVVVECDGFTYHSDRKAFREDRRRDRELAARGYVPLRFTYHDVMGDPGVVVREVRRVLARLTRSR